MDNKIYWYTVVQLADWPHFTMSTAAFCIHLAQKLRFSHVAVLAY